MTNTSWCDGVRLVGVKHSSCARHKATSKTLAAVTIVEGDCEAADVLQGLCISSSFKYVSTVFSLLAFFCAVLGGKDSPVSLSQLVLVFQ